MESEGKITVELDYRYEHGVVRLTHPDLDGELAFDASSERLAQVQVESLNLVKPKTPIEEIVADSQELVQAMAGLKQMVPEIMSALKGRKNGN